jgi:hypothetical protein
LCIRFVAIRDVPFAFAATMKEMAST